MQRTKQTVLFFLCILLVLSFSGCDQSERLEALSGTWYTLRTTDAETAAKVLQSIDLYEPELALIDPPALQYCQSVQFRVDQSYTFSYDTAASLPFLRNFFQEAFAQLYEGRGALSKLYRENFEDMSQSDFYAFYAQLYMQEDFQALLDYFTQKLTVAEGKILEEGRFTLWGDELQCTPVDADAKAIRYRIDDRGGLLLTYENGSELYTREIPN